MTPLFGFGEFLFHPTHIILLLIVGVLLFGKRLPEIGRSLGKGLIEFKKGIKGLEDDVDAGGGAVGQQARYDQPVEQPRPPQRIAATAPKFEDNPAPAVTRPSTTPKFDDGITTPPKV
jgi:sec-independent protein translocase protein TatA